MHRSALRIVVAAVLLCGATVAYARLNGPPKSVTGAPAIGTHPAEPTCQFCHDPAHVLNDPSGQLQILDLPAQFDVNTDYPIRVRLAHTWDPTPPDPLNWGFQLTAVRADSGVSYGTFVPGPGTQIATQVRPGADPTRTYIEHTGTGTRNGEVGPVEWAFTWHSPSYVAIKVRFFAAGNSANGDNLSSNDYIFTTRDSTEFVNVGVPEMLKSHSDLMRPSPNPFHGRTELSISQTRSGSVDLAVYDITGRRIRALFNGRHDAGAWSVTWDGRDDSGVRRPNGLYFARLVAPGAPLPRVQKLTLTR